MTIDGRMPDDWRPARAFQEPRLAVYFRCTSSRAFANRSRQLSSRPRSASARAANSSACKVVRSDAPSLFPSFVPGDVPGAGDGVTSGIVGMRVSVLGGGAMTDRSSVCGGVITPPERPSSCVVVPGPRFGTPRSGVATGGSVAMPWRSASWRTWSKQLSAAAASGHSTSKARLTKRRRAVVEEGRCMPNQRHDAAMGCAMSEAVQSRRIVDQDLLAHRFVRHTPEEQPQQVVFLRDLSR